jgi:hypothetical protein
VLVAVPRLASYIAEVYKTSLRVAMSSNAIPPIQLAVRVRE